MDLTISELAHAVGKTENYVRQHVHRKHLIARRVGRNVFVPLDQAARWARERGLPFDAPARALSAVPLDMNDRVARITVLTWYGPDARTRNVFTFIRHRRQDALGPWANDLSKRWSSEDLGHGLRLLTLDVPFEECTALVDRILDSSAAEIGGFEVDYSLNPTPRCHWAYRDHCPSTEASMQSPFSRHSAKIIEYWSFGTELRDRWLEILESSRGGSPPSLLRLGFPLDRRVDRVGNLMIAGAEDALSCDLTAGHDRTLRFNVDADDLLPNTYRATVWCSFSGNDVLRREIAVTPGQTSIQLASDVDHLGFAIFRTVDGQCIDLMQAFPAKELSFTTKISSKPTLHIKDRRGRLQHKVTPAGSAYMSSVRADEDITDVDNGIRRLWLERRLHEREAEAQRKGDIVRFQPAEFDQAVKHIVHLLSRDSHRTEPVYLADPYFMPYLDEKPGAVSDLVQLYLELFAATTGRSLRILCAQMKQADPRPWWAPYPKSLMNHVSVRTFFKRDQGNPDESKRGFHDRYLITPEHEVIITNSLNGWREQGVTFISHRQGVYRAEAENLWALDLQSATESLWAEEIP